MGYLRINLILVSAIFLLFPVVCGLDFSMGTSNGVNGASESLKINVGLDNTLVSSTQASPGYYSTSATNDGPGPLDFNETFDSSDSGEHVRLIAKMADSVNHIHDFVIENQANNGVRVSQSLTADQGINIECSAQAWNSLGQSAKVGLKIPAGSLTAYSNYGNATDASVTAFQTATVPKNTRFNVFAEAKRGYSAQSSSSTLLSSRALNAQTTNTVTSTKSVTKSVLRYV